MNRLPVSAYKHREFEGLPSPKAGARQGTRKRLFNYFMGKLLTTMSIDRTLSILSMSMTTVYIYTGSAAAHSPITHEILLVIYIPVSATGGSGNAVPQPFGGCSSNIFQNKHKTPSQLQHLIAKELTKNFFKNSDKNRIRKYL